MTSDADTNDLQQLDHHADNDHENQNGQQQLNDLATMTPIIAGVCDTITTTSGADETSTGFKSGLLTEAMRMNNNNDEHETKLPQSMIENNTSSLTTKSLLSNAQEENHNNHDNEHHHSTQQDLLSTNQHHQTTATHSASTLVAANHYNSNNSMNNRDFTTPPSTLASTTTIGKESRLVLQTTSSNDYFISSSTDSKGYKRSVFGDKVDSKYKYRGVIPQNSDIYSNDGSGRSRFVRLSRRDENDEEEGNRVDDFHYGIKSSGDDDIDDSDTDYDLTFIERNDSLSHGLDGASNSHNIDDDGGNGLLLGSGIRSMVDAFHIAINPSSTRAIADSNDDDDVDMGCDQDINDREEFESKPLVSTSTAPISNYSSVSVEGEKKNIDATTVEDDEMDMVVRSKNEKMEKSEPNLISSLLTYSNLLPKSSSSSLPTTSTPPPPPSSILLHKENHPEHHDKDHHHHVHFEKNPIHHYQTTATTPIKKRGIIPIDSPPIEHLTIVASSSIDDSDGDSDGCGSIISNNNDIEAPISPLTPTHTTTHRQRQRRVVLPSITGLKICSLENPSDGNETPTKTTVQTEDEQEEEEKIHEGGCLAKKTKINAVKRSHDQHEVRHPTTRTDEDNQKILEEDIVNLEKMRKKNIRKKDLQLPVHDSAEDNGISLDSSRRSYGSKTSSLATKPSGNTSKQKKKSKKSEVIVTYEDGNGFSKNKARSNGTSTNDDIADINNESSFDLSYGGPDAISLSPSYQKQQAYEEYPSQPPGHVAIKDPTIHAQSFILSLAFFFIWTPQNLMAPNLTQMAEYFHFSPEQRDLYLGANIAFATGVLSLPLSALLGFFADVVPSRKRLFAGTVFCGGIASICTGLSETYAQLYFARFLCGGCMSGSVVIVFSMLGDLFDAKSRNAASSGLTAMMGAGILMGQVFAGTVGDRSGWKKPFMLCGYSSIVSSFMVLIFVREPVRGGKEVVLQEMISKGTSYDRKLTFGGFIHAMTKNKTNVILMLQGFFTNVPWGIIFTFLNDYLSQEQELSVPVSTLLVFWFGIGSAIGGVAGGYFGQLAMKVNRAMLPLFMSLSTFLGIFPFLGLLDMKLKGRMALSIFLALMGGIIANLPSVNVRPCLLNVNPPETRGVSMTAANLMVNVARGAGPSLITFTQAAYGASRKYSFNVTLIIFWSITTLLLVVLAKTLPEDQDRMDEELKRYAESKMHAVKHPSIRSVNLDNISVTDSTASFTDEILDNMSLEAGGESIMSIEDRMQSFDAAAAQQSLTFIGDALREIGEEISHFGRSSSGGGRYEDVWDGQSDYELRRGRSELITNSHPLTRDTLTRGASDRRVQYGDKKRSNNDMELPDDVFEAEDL